MQSITQTIQELGKNAKNAHKSLMTCSDNDKNALIKNIIKNIDANRELILAENKKDLDNGKAKKLSNALLDRLMLNNERIDSIIQSLKQISNISSNIGEINDLRTMKSGIKVGKMRVPIGVIGIIYESRPNITIDATAICIKSGNTVILRGGSESINSNIALHFCIKEAFKGTDIDENCVQIIKDTDRKIIQELVKAKEYIDLIIPRGGPGLIENVITHSKIPIIKHLHGVCHTYLDKYANHKKAVDIAFNGKTRRYGVCNATETLLVHKDLDKKALNELINLYIAKGVELRGCKETQKLSNKIIPAKEQDWYEEYLDAILAIRIVDSMEQAIEHIQKYGSSHTDAIVTENITYARKFLLQVDSSSVIVNASTGFADGSEYGLGAEVGISTDKIHVRGPVGIKGLTSEKYIVLGDGHIRK